MFNDMFNHVFCINLDRRSDRWTESYENFTRLGINVERFSAFDCQEIQNINSDWDKYAHASIACALSHIAILKVAKSRGYKNVFIFEDDVEFFENFNEKFEVLRKQIPENWDMFYLSANPVAEILPISKNLLKCNKLHTTHAYGVRDNVYDLLIRAGQNFLHGIDTNYTDIHPHINCYLASPPLVTQKKGYSDLQYKETDYHSLSMNHGDSEYEL
jgi:GR25 family glycosyltransferase involved in LPS biosynthesis